MADRVKQIPARVLEWWNKFTSKQKTIIVSVAAGVVVAVAILMTMITRPQYETLIVCETTKEAAEIKELLDGETIKYNISDDGYTIQVLEADLSDATLLLGANNYPTYGYGIDNVFEGGFSTTEADKTKKYKLYMEDKMSKDLVANELVDAAYVTLNLPQDDGTLIAEKEEAYASITLTLNGEMSNETAAALARFVATALGNKTTENIVLLDSTGTLLFSGEDDASTSGGASNRLSFKSQYETLVKNEIKDALVIPKIYDNVQVVPNLALDWSVINQVVHEYYAPDGQTQGVYSHEESFESESSGGNGGVPGTDANDEDVEDTYVIDQTGVTQSTQTEYSRDYLPNERITTTDQAGGAILYDTSSLGITAIHYVVYNEADLRTQGLLDGMSFDEFRLANSERVKTEVDEDIYNVVAAATGIPVGNISIVAYDEPLFVADDSTGVTASDVIQIGLIILILGLLGFVVFRSMRPEKSEEPEEELSLDGLLQSTQEAQGLEDIDLEEKSEVRTLIEKFVDESPDAVANLLRNWLTEDWG